LLLLLVVVVVQHELDFQELLYILLCAWQLSCGLLLLIILGLSLCWGSSFRVLLLLMLLLVVILSRGRTLVLLGLQKMLLLPGSTWWVAHVLAQRSANIPGGPLHDFALPLPIKVVVWPLLMLLLALGGQLF